MSCINYKKSTNQNLTFIDTSKSLNSNKDNDFILVQKRVKKVNSI